MTYRSLTRFALAPLLAVVVLAIGPTVMAPPAFARSAPESFADLAEKLLPAVVNIATTTKITDAGRGDPDLEELFRQFFDRQRRGQGGDQNGDNGGSGGDQNGDNGGSGGDHVVWHRSAPRPRGTGGTLRGPRRHRRRRDGRRVRRV